MADAVEELRIEIDAKASKANDAIDRLVGKLDRLTTSLNKVEGFGSKLNTMSAGVQRLSIAMQGMNNVKTADFTRLARNLQTLNSLDTSKLGNLSTNIIKISTAFNGLSGMNSGAEQVSILANGIKQLGYSSVDKAITNIPLLATAMKRLMSELSTAPKVSQNLIEMTNALAKLARTGASSGKAADSLSKSFDRVSKSSNGMKAGLLGSVNGISNIRTAILQSMGVAGGFYAVFQGIKESINIASELTEVQNVVDVTFGDYKKKIEDLAKVSIPELGMSMLTTKQIGSRFQAMGTAMGFAQGRMADMSVSLTRLAGDMASFYNVEQKDVARSLQSVFTGEAEPMRKYGVDLTNATIQQWALNRGMQVNVNTMSQMQKATLRYQYVMESTKAAQGDFIRTQDTWANQIRVLKENIKSLGIVWGSAFINMLKPLVQSLNKALEAVYTFSENVVNALGKIFGWKLEIQNGNIADDFDSASDGADDLASGLGTAANNAKKLKQQLQGFDELNVLTTPSDSAKGSSKPSGSAGGSGVDSNKLKFNLQETEGLYKSSIENLEQLGEYVGNSLKKAMDDIPWDDIYQKAKNFGKGLASFLNGLISPGLFSTVGKTIANSLNTALYALNSFGETFEWEDFGESIASGINNFFATFDFINLADTINTWVDGIKATLVKAIKDIEWKDVIKGAFDFVDGLELDTIMISIAAFKWFFGGKELVAGALNSLLEKTVKLGIGKRVIPLSTSINLSIITAIVGFKIGNWIYKSSKTVQKFSDAIAKWIVDTTTGKISIPKAITVSLGSLTVAVGSAKIAKKIAKSIKNGITSGAFKDFGKKVSVLIVDNMKKVPSLLKKSASVLKAIGSTIAGKIFLGISAAIAGWEIGKTIYNKLDKDINGNNAIDKFVEKTGLGDLATRIADFFQFELPDFTQKAINWGKTFSNGLLSGLPDWAKKILGIDKNYNSSGDAQSGGGSGKSFTIELNAKKGKDFDSVVNNAQKEGNKKIVFSGNAGRKDKKGTYNYVKNAIQNANITKMVTFKSKDTFSKLNAGWQKSLNSTTLTKMVTLKIDGTKQKVQLHFNADKSSGNYGYTWMTKAAKGGAFYNGSWHNIKQYAVGGIPEHGSMFVAGEKGPEVVGHVGGRTEVLNQSQLASVMYDSVSRAMAQYSNNVNVKLEGDAKQLFKMTQEKANEHYRKTGRPAFSM